MSARWAVAAASVTGSMHLQEDGACQDAWAVHWFDWERGIVVVADGAGSHAHSGMGAALTVSNLGRLTGRVPGLLSEDALPAERLDEEWRRVVRDEFRALRDLLRESAARLDVPFEQMGCTAILAAFSPTLLLAAHVGDGRACASTKPGEWRSLIVPNKGEQVGETLFVTLDAWDNEEFWKGNAVAVRGDVRGFALLTDGCEKACFRCWVPGDDPAVCHDPNEPFAPFFEPNLAAVAAMTQDGVSQEEIGAHWERFLSAGLPAFEREHDDRTMVFFARLDGLSEGRQE